MAKARNKMPHRQFDVDHSGPWIKRWEGVTIVVYRPKSYGEILGEMMMIDFCKKEAEKRNVAYSSTELSNIKMCATSCVKKGNRMFSALFGQYITLRKKLDEQKD